MDNTITTLTDQICKNAGIISESSTKEVITERNKNFEKSFENQGIIMNNLDDVRKKYRIK
jgi:hypothetical protein